MTVSPEGCAINSENSMAHSLGIRGNILPRHTPRSVPVYGTSPVFSDNWRSQCRPFSHTKSTAVKAGIMSAESVMPKPPPQHSLRTRMRDLNPDKVPTDFGVLPGTFIRPEGKDMPNFFKQPKERLRFEWVWLKTWVQSAFA